jgi:DnaJ-class molecular chaperone
VVVIVIVVTMMFCEVCDGNGSTRLLVVMMMFCEVCDGSGSSDDDFL